MRANDWYRIQAKADTPTEAEIIVHGFIGEDAGDATSVTCRRFVEQVKALPKTVRAVRVHVHSLGGSPFDALAIHNVLQEQRRQGRTVTVRVDGIAASAATIIVAAGNPVEIVANGLLMVHCAFVLHAGNADSCRRMADALDTIDQSIITSYLALPTMRHSRKALLEMMEAETWMDADEAIAQGFATAIVPTAHAPAQTASARAEFAAASGRGLRIAAQAPATIAARVSAFLPPVSAATEPTPPQYALEVLRACGTEYALAEELIAARAPLAEVHARLERERAARTTREQARAFEVHAITAMCAMCHLPELAPGYIQAGTPWHQVRDHLVVLRAAVDERTGEIDGSLDPFADETRAHAQRRHLAKDLSANAIYARRNANPLGGVQ